MCRSRSHRREAVDPVVMEYVTKHLLIPRPRDGYILWRLLKTRDTNDGVARV